LVRGDDAPIRQGEPPLRLQVAGTRAEARGPACTIPVPGLSHLGSLLPPIPEGAGAGEQPTSRPCSTDESVAALPPLPVTERSFLPWALVPFKVLRPPLRPGVTRETHCSLRGVARFQPLSKMVFHPLAGRSESLRGFPCCSSSRRCTLRSEVADGVPAERLFSASARPRSATRRAHLLPGDGRRAGASGVCPVAEVRFVPGPRCRRRLTSPEGLACRWQPRGARYRPS
jgi:hypothetical protein